MVMGIPNKIIILGLLAMAYFVPQRTKLAGGAVQSTAEAISGSLTALGSTRFEPVFNPSVGLSGNIGERIVSRAFGDDDPSGDPNDKYQAGGGEYIWIKPVDDESEPEYVEGPFGPGLTTTGPSAWELITSDDY